MKSVFNKIEKERSKEVVFPVLAEHTSALSKLMIH